MINIESYAFLQPLLEKGISEGVFPMASAAVGCRDLLFATANAGGATEHTLFDIASMSKVFAPTMLALRDIEGGTLTLYDTVSRYFPEAPPDKAEITILQLMTHTSRITPHYYLSEDAGTPDGVVASILRHPLDDLPEGTPAYSCIGYILLGKILEQIHGQPLNKLADERVFRPLGMAHTGYCPQGDNIAPTEVDPATGIAWQGIVHDENARFLGGVSANAGVFSDVLDCARFCQMLACGGQGYLSPAMLRKAIHNYTPGYDVHRGLGFHLAGTTYNYMGDLFPDDSFGHTGFTGTCFAIDPATGLWTVLLTNRVHPTRENLKLMRFRRAFHNRVYAAFSHGSVSC